jgi:hypothetical protein
MAVGLSKLNGFLPTKGNLKIQMFISERKLNSRSGRIIARTISRQAQWQLVAVIGSFY